MNPSAKALAYARRDGVFASMDGLSRSQNPYATWNSVWTAMHKAWDEGWMKNEDERRVFLGQWESRMLAGNYEDFET